MTISSTSASVVGRGNGATTAFPYAFKIPTAADVQIIYTDVSGNLTTLQSSQYTISGLGLDTGGTVTYPLSGSPIPAGSSITIARVLAVTQPTALTNQGGYFPNVVEGALDRIVMLLQQAIAGFGTVRALLFPASDVNPTQTLPPSAARANKYLAFDGSGNPVVLGGTSSNPDVSANTVVANTATSARTLADRMAERADPRDFGALGNGVHDDTAAIQAAVNTGRPVYFPAGVYKITAQINFNTIGQSFCGDAMELCVITLTGAIRGFVSSGSLVRCEFRNLTILGDVTTLDAIDVSSGTLYESNWQNLTIYTGGRAIYAPVEFSNVFQNIQFNSRNNNGIEIKGDVGTTLISCYCHRIDTNGKYGFRIYGGGTLIGCNGLDYGEYWGLFGAAVADGDPGDQLYNPTFIGCNFEDYRKTGLKFKFNGRIVMMNCTFFPPDAGTSPTYDTSIWINFTDQLIELHNVLFQSKGATRNKLSDIFSAAGGAPLLFGMPGISWDDNGLLTTIPNIVTTQPEFAVFAMSISKATFGRAYGFYSPAVAAWTPNATTFSVVGVDRVQTANTLATVLATATGGVDGQMLVVCVRDTHTTIKHLAGSSGQFLNKSGADIVATNGQPYMYFLNNGSWVQV